MKVGILSMQKVMNYGSFLQSFALKKTIEEFGHQCEFIDIEQGRIFPELKRTLLFLTRNVLERYCKWDVLRRIRYTYIFQQRFLHEFFEMLGTNIHTINFFDVVVIGSDEVFNFAQRVPWGYTLQLFGKVSNANKVISYAGSFGHTTIWDIEHYGVKEEISGALNSMRAISVRDANSCEIVEKLTRNEPQIHVDPVLMFDYLPYVKPIDKKDYIIIYTYPNRIRNKKEIDAIKRFAHKYNKKLISIGFYFSWCDETIIPEPFEVLGYIKEADYVVTDTFHGSVMSLKFNKQFAVLVRSTNKQKMISLLSQFHLTDRIVDCSDSLENKLLLHSDYEFVNSELQKERLRSLEFLRLNLQ